MRNRIRIGAAQRRSVALPPTTENMPKENVLPVISVRGFRRILSLLLAAVILLLLFSYTSLHADDVTNATVTVDAANVRSAPGTSSAILVKITNGTRVMASEVVSVPADPSGYTVWCRISVSVNGILYDGYIVNSYLLKDPTAIDPVFETAISGFPDSYRPALRSLHEAHPSWVFNPVNVATDWSTVVAAESTIGTSLITSSADDSWKSTDPYAYIWLTNTYTPYDGTSWVNASQGIVAYYLDPRNFENEMYIFQFLNLSYDAGTQTQDAVQKLLNNTFMASALITDFTSGAQIPYAQAFMQAGAASGASPYELVSRVIQEVSAQGSRSTYGTEPGYVGYYNYYNIGASSSADPVILGLTFAQYGSNNPGKYPMSADDQAKYLIPWNSPYRSIAGGAIYIAKNYIQKGQNTLYLQKFDVTDDGNGTYRHQYMTNIQAMVGESTTLYNAYSKSGILDIPLTFKIPVYTNMPDTATPQPPKTGNPNNYLTSLSIDGYSLTPSFDPTVTDGYSLIVPYQISSIHLNAVPVTTLASVSGAGDMILNVGTNLFPITVTAGNGTIRTYNISVIRNEQSGEDLYSTTYRVNADNTIAGITPGTTVTDLSAGITLINGGQIGFVNAAGTPITDPLHIIATGDRIQVINSSAVVVYDYTALIYGDANGDGKISSSDLTVICRHVLKQANLSGASLLSADANHDGKVSSSDLTIVCRQVLKQSSITQ